MCQALCALVWIGLCGGTSLAANPEREPLRVRVMMTPEDVELGRPFVLQVFASHRPGEEVIWPRAEDLGPAFEEITRRVEVGAQEDEWVTSELVIEAAAFDTEVQELPRLPVGLRSSPDLRVQTRSLPVQVSGLVDLEKPGMRPMAPPVSVPVRNTKLLLLLGTVPMAVMFIALALSMRRRGKTSPKKEARPEPTRLPPYDEALARLEILEVAGLFDEADLKRAYLAMSEILRDYLGRRFGFSSLDLTTSEFRTRLQEVDLESPAWREGVLDWLTGCDLVKFAKSAAAKEEALEALARARELVEQSQAEPAEPAKEKRDG